MTAITSKNPKNKRKYSQFLRLRRICSDHLYYEKTAQLLKQPLVDRKYRVPILNGAIEEASNRSRRTLLKPNFKDSDADRETFLINLC